MILNKFTRYDFKKFQLVDFTLYFVVIIMGIMVVLSLISLTILPQKSNTLIS